MMNSDEIHTIEETFWIGMPFGKPIQAFSNLFARYTRIIN